jgi:hypothetical protein
VQQAHGFGKSGVESYHLEDFSTFRRKKPFRFFIFCNFEKTKMVFARFGFSWNFRLSYPRLRQALSRYTTAYQKTLSKRKSLTIKF